MDVYAELLSLVRENIRIAETSRQIMKQTESTQQSGSDIQFKSSAAFVTSNDVSEPNTKFIPYDCGFTSIQRDGEGGILRNEIQKNSESDEDQPFKKIPNQEEIEVSNEIQVFENNPKKEETEVFHEVWVFDKMSGRSVRNSGGPVGKLMVNSEPIQYELLTSGLGIEVESKPIMESNKMLAEIGAIDRRVIERLEEEADVMNKRPLKYVWVLDKFKVEQESGITIDARWKFANTNYYCTLIDTHGHRDLIKGMTADTFQAGCDVLINDSITGDLEDGISMIGQTCTLLAFIIHVKEIICYCEKIDAATPTTQRLKY